MNLPEFLSKVNEGGSANGFADFYQNERGNVVIRVTFQDGICLSSEFSKGEMLAQELISEKLEFLYNTVTCISQGIEKIHA